MYDKRYNTGNPVGSPDPRDSYDNKANFDIFAISEDPQYVDRLGKSRLTLAGMEQVFNDALIDIGFQNVGDYTSGLVITSYNQTVRDANGSFWRISGQTDLPYTTTGAGLPEDGAFFLAGDIDLRSDLSGAPSSGLGAMLVNGSTISVKSIKEMLELDTNKITDGTSVVVSSFYGTSGGESCGIYAWEVSGNKQKANGGTIIDPIAGAIFDGTQASLSDYLSAQLSAIGSGVWIKYKDDQSVVYPHEFGYSGDWVTGMVSVEHIFKFFKRDGGGHIKMPSGEFYLGGQKKYRPGTGDPIVEMGSNVTWEIPVDSTVYIDDCFAMVWRPTGYGYDGGEKNFSLIGGGTVSGLKRTGSVSFLSMNMTHLTGIFHDKVKFVECGDGHIYDLMGCKDITIDIEFHGSTLDFSTTRSGKEFIQLDCASDAGRRYPIQSDNRWLDFIPCSNVTINRLVTKAFRDEGGTIISYPQIAIGAHAFDCANIDSLKLNNVSIEQISPDAQVYQFSNFALVIPPCDNLEINGLSYKALAPSTIASFQVGLLTVYNTTQRVMDTESASPTVTPTYKTIARLKPTNRHWIENINFDFKAFGALAVGSTSGRAIVCGAPCDINNVIFDGVDNSLSTTIEDRTGFDLFTLSRNTATDNGGNFQFDIGDKWTVRNVKIINGVINTFFEFRRGTLEVSNVTGSAIRAISENTAGASDVSITMDGVVISHGNNIAGGSPNFVTSNLKLSNCVFNSGSSTIPDISASGSGYVVNCAFKGALPASWTGNASLKLANNINLSL